MNWWAIIITAPVLFLVLACASIFIYVCIWSLYNKLITNRLKRNCYDCKWAARDSKSNYILCYHPEIALSPYRCVPIATVNEGGLLLYYDGQSETIIHRCDCWRWDRVFSNLKWQGKKLLINGKLKKPKKVKKGFSYY